MYTWLVTSPNLWVTLKGFLYKHIKRYLLRLYLQLFVEGLKSYLRYLCLFVYSGVVYLFFLSSSCVPYVVGFSGLSTLIAPLVLFSNGWFPIYFILVYIYICVVEWSRALDVRLSEWCCSVSMVWVQIPSREEQNFTALKSNSNTVWFKYVLQMEIGVSYTMIGLLDNISAKFTMWKDTVINWANM